MDEFLNEVAEKLKRCKTQLKIRTTSNAFSGMWLKRMEDKNWLWDGYATIYENLFQDMPYLAKIMRDYECELDIEMQSLTNIYWFTLKSPTHPVITVRSSSLIDGFSKLEEIIQAEYENTKKYFEEEFLRSISSCQVQFENNSYSIYKNNGFRIEKINGNNIPIVISDYKMVQKVLMMEQKNLLMQYVHDQEIYESDLNDCVGTANDLDGSLRNLENQMLELHKKGKEHLVKVNR